MNDRKSDPDRWTCVPVSPQPKPSNGYLVILHPPTSDSLSPGYVSCGPMPEGQGQLMRNWLNAIQEQWNTRHR